MKIRQKYLDKKNNNLTEDTILFLRKLLKVFVKRLKVSMCNS